MFLRHKEYRLRIYLLDDFFCNSYVARRSNAEESKYPSIPCPVLADERISLEWIVGKPTRSSQEKLFLQETLLKTQAESTRKKTGKI
jgi:hypothetical protein